MTFLEYVLRVQYTVMSPEFRSQGLMAWVHGMRYTGPTLPDPDPVLKDHGVALPLPEPVYPKNGDKTHEECFQEWMRKVVP